MKSVLDGLDITEYIYGDGASSSGGGWDNSLTQNPESKLVSLENDGARQLSYQYDMRFTARDIRNIVRAHVAQVAEGDWFVPFDDGYGHRLPAYGVSMIQARHKQAPSVIGSKLLYNYTLGIELEDPKLWDVTAEYMPLFDEDGYEVLTESGEEMLFPVDVIENNWDPTLDAYSRYFDNYGDLECPAVFHCQITGAYSTYHLENLTLEVYDGTTLESSLILSDEFLTDEVFTLQQVGTDWILSQTYTDDFSSGTKFSQDGHGTGASVTGGSLLIETSEDVQYYLTGVHPIIDGGLLVTFTPTESGSGEVALETSLDSGVTWNEIINNSDNDWTDGQEMAVYALRQGDIGYKTVYIRFVCDSSITSCTIDDLTIYQERNISRSDIPMIPVGATRRIKFVDGTTSSNSATIDATFRRCYNG